MLRFVTVIVAKLLIKKAMIGFIVQLESHFFINF